MSFSFVSNLISVFTLLPPARPSAPLQSLVKVCLCSIRWLAFSLDHPVFSAPETLPVSPLPSLCGLPHARSVPVAALSHPLPLRVSRAAAIPSSPCLSVQWFLLQLWAGTRALSGKVLRPLQECRWVGKAGRSVAVGAPVRSRTAV